MATEPSYRQLAAREAGENMTEATKVFSRAAGEKTTIKLMNAFLYIAQHEDGVAATDCAEYVNLSIAGMHRLAGRLGDVDRLGEPGLGFIEPSRDKRDSRRTIYRLTEQGRKIRDEMTLVMVGPHRDERRFKTLVSRLKVEDPDDREQFERFGINPDHAYIFGVSRLAEVVDTLHELSLGPERLRPNPFGGYAVTFEDEESAKELLFFIRWKNM